MNERIKQLAEQAEFNLWNNEAWKPEGQVVDWSIDYDKELEKFAQLIVEECCKVLQSEVIQHDGYGYNQFALHNRIKKHFLGSNDRQAQLDEEWYRAIK